MAIVFSSFNLLAQRTAGGNSLMEDYRLGLELLNKEKFGAAQHQFDKVIISIPEMDSEMRINAEYYRAICAIELFNKDAEHLLTGFISEHPESPHVKKAHFQLGRYNYRKKRWEKAIDWFNKVDIYELSNTELGEYYFKLGYSYFRNGNTESALKALYEIKDADTKYTVPARYYYGHMSYRQGRYQTALGMFRKIQKDPKFGVIVPYYITQILYLQHKYDELLAYAPALLDSAIPKRAPEIAHLIGDAYYRKALFKEAIPYMEMYFNKSVTTREDEYQLGYCYYETGNYEQAIRILKRLGTKKDEIAQAALYHLGDCYRKMDEPLYALNTFLEASKLDYDPKMQEDALYNYAVLSGRVSYDPYNEAIEALNLYLDKYPQSIRREEVLQYLVNLYLTTHNYESALKSLEKIESPGLQLRRAYQTLQYNLAVEKFSNGRYEEAIACFNAAGRYNEDRLLAAKSIYWIAESEYMLNRYNRAMTHYKEYIYAPAAILDSNFILAYYNAGYAGFKSGNYADAITWFRKFTDDQNSKAFADKRSDALLRIADAYFTRKDYFSSEKYYAEAAAMAERDADYGIYQRAVVLGLLQRKDDKLIALKGLLEKYPESDYTDDAMYMLGQGYMLDDPAKSLAYFEEINRKYPAGKYSKDALLQTGIIHHNLNDDEKALDIFKHIAANYRSYEDAREAISYARNIYIEEGSVDAFKQWIGELEYYQLTVTSLDSADFKSAYLKYFHGDYEQAALAFDKYLSAYDAPVYALKAHYYKADCDYRSERYAEALGGYNYVINQSPNRFMLSSLLYASRINYHFNQYQEALSNYIMLEKMADTKQLTSEAEIGQMRCFSALGNYEMALEYAEKVLENQQGDPALVTEAYMIKGDAARELNRMSLAIEEYRAVADGNASERSAEAQYKIAAIYFQAGDFKMAEREVQKLISEKSSYKRWMARGMILLADIYAAGDEIFQARATLKSVLRHHKGDDKLKKEAQDKLNQLNEREKETQRQQEAERDGIFEIVFDADHFDVDSLFGEDQVLEEPLKVELLENE
ncbi:MAG: tetratricopeptide repeat protein [Flavobacteriales bacterium]